MVVNGDTVPEQYLRKHPTKAALWSEQRKLVDDPRVTPLGALLRNAVSPASEVPRVTCVLISIQSGAVHPIKN